MGRDTRNPCAQSLLLAAVNLGLLLTIFLYLDKKYQKSSVCDDETLVPAKSIEKRIIAKAEFNFNEVPERTVSCKNHNTLLVMIKSSATNFGVRSAIRETWLQKLRHNAKLPETVTLDYFFNVASAVNTTVQQRLITESKYFGDILLSDFSDQYDTLTVKTIAGMTWASACFDDESIKESSIFLTIDDDVFLDVDYFVSNYLTPNLNSLNILSDLKNTEKSYSTDSKTVKSLSWPTEHYMEQFSRPGFQWNGIFSVDCLYRNETKAIVHRDGKWAVSEQLWENHLYPHYCWGAAVAFPGLKAVDYILTVANSEEGNEKSSITVDDALLFGIFRTIDLGGGRHSTPGIRGYFDVPEGTKDEKSPSRPFVFHLANPENVNMKLQIASSLKTPEQLKNWFHFYKQCLPKDEEEKLMNRRGISLGSIRSEMVDFRKRLRRRRDVAEAYGDNEIPADLYYCPINPKW